MKKMPIFLKGIMIGLSIAAPVGPIGVLCIRRTINQGRLYGFVSGMGAASADAVYGLIAALGFNIITQLLVEQQLWIRLIGGLFLCYLGYQAMKTTTRDSVDTGISSRLTSAYGTTFVLTLTNPLTILSFIGVFAGISTAEPQTLGSLGMVAGIFIGSLLWWLLLSVIVGSARRMLNGKAVQWINRLSGMVLILFGLFSVAGLIGGLGE